jgi:hypothetical protein
MAVKASLKIILMANDVEIAESVDSVLWQSVFAAITQGSSQVSGIQSGNPASQTLVDKNSNKNGSVLANNSGGATPIGKFAFELGVTTEEIEGALGPTNVEPFIHLDPHCWEALKKNTPARGPQAVAPIALAGTVLALWFKHAGIDGLPTIKQCQAVLNTIHTRDANAARSLKNTEWLQSRGNGIVINPAQRSRAVALATSYCRKSPIEQS